MRPKTYNKAGQKPPTKPQLTIYGDDNLDDPPASSSDEDIKANIQPTKFTKRSKSPTDMKAGNAGGGTKTSVINERGTGSSRIEKIPANSTSGSSMGKRKHPAAQEDLFRGKGRSEGENMVDIFGRVTQKKKPRSSYGSSSQSRSSQPGPIPQKAAGSPNALPRFQKIELEFDVDKSPESSQESRSSRTRHLLFKPQIETSPAKPKNSPRKQLLFKPDEIKSSPAKSKSPTNSFAAPIGFENSPTSTQAMNTSFKVPRMNNSSVSGNKTGESFTDAYQLEENSPSSTPSSLKELAQVSVNAVPLRRDPKNLWDLSKNNLGGTLAARIQDIVGDEADIGGIFDGEYETSVAEEARCPMCNQPCDPAELQKWGAMNTRQQEKFCRSHRKTNAEKKWNLKGYPEIDWDRLESRISEHHDFIETLLHGAKCHYRRAFEELVAAGKGRSLKKMEANLIPGYYGSRGLNVISAHVIDEFSELLSDKSMDDGLISKRGTTAFVQSVIVPEVTVRLIMEDMSVEEVEARNVLSESSNVGELVHEEIRDVILDQDEHSDDEEVK